MSFYNVSSFRNYNFSSFFEFKGKNYKWIIEFAGVCQKIFANIFKYLPRFFLRGNNMSKSSSIYYFKASIQTDAGVDRNTREIEKIWF